MASRAIALEKARTLRAMERTRLELAQLEGRLAKEREKLVAAGDLVAKLEVRRATLLDRLSREAGKAATAMEAADGPVDLG